MPVATIGVDPSQRESIVDRIAKDGEMSEELAESCFEETLKFLVVSQSTEARVSPSKLIDVGWHAFILHTRTYTDFCLEQFGRYVHHQPTPGSNSDGYLRARSLAKEMFGELDVRFWPESGAGPCAPDSDCHDDDSCDAV